MKKTKREKIILNERWKIEEGVFDKSTLITLSRMMEKGLFNSIDYLISPGKEANVYRAKKGKSYVAVKIYKIETSNFLKRTLYLFGDKRFSQQKLNDRNLVYLFTSKEFKNLNSANKCIPVPTPYYHEKNVIVMSFLGEDGIPYSKLKEIVDKEDFYTIMEQIRALYKCKLIHADLSWFNILKGDKLYFIDFGQSVPTTHPKADMFLKRDVKNIIDEFNKKFKMNLSLDKWLEYVKQI